MADRFASFIKGLGLSSLPGSAATEEQRLAWYRKHNIEPPPVKPSPLKRAAKWIGDRLAQTPGDAAAQQAPTAEGVGLVERLKAGNIDEYGSEAYNRWGQGKADGDVAELAREAARTTPGSPSATPDVVAAAPEPETMTPEMWDNAPLYAQSNPDWKDLPDDDVAIEVGAQE